MDILVAKLGSRYPRSEAIRTHARGSNGATRSHANILFFILIIEQYKDYFVSLTAVPETLIINIDHFPTAS